MSEKRNLNLHPTKVVFKVAFRAYGRETDERWLPPPSAELWVPRRL